MIFGAYQYYLQGNVNVIAALVIALFFSIGIYFGSKYAQSINPETLKIIFGFMIILIGIKMVAA